MTRLKKFTTWVYTLRYAYAYDHDFCLFLFRYILQVSMSHVRFPSNDMHIAQLVQKQLQDDFDTYIVVIQTANTGPSSPDFIYVRLSAQIYLELGDFQVIMVDN